MSHRILWVGGTDETSREARELVGEVYGIEWLAELSSALESLRRTAADVVVWESSPTATTPEDAVEELHRLDPTLPVVVIDPGLSTPRAVRLAHLGVLECHVDASDAEAVLASVAGAIRDCLGFQSNAERPAEPWKKILIGDSRPIREIEHIIRLVGSRRCTVLISGETGTGKEVVARALHMASPRANGPMVAVNCSAIPGNLLEAELFGHVKGAFTGATGFRVGRFEQANKGTLFLDEIADLPVDLQAKLLRVLQEREFQRLGSSENVRVDVRVIAATNANLAERVRRGEFREDLYYRLNVVPVALPPLRERSDDVGLLARHFVEKHCRLEGIPTKQISPEAIRRLSAHTWPGNVRQLENAIEMAIALSGDRPLLVPADFPVCLSAPTPMVVIQRSSTAAPSSLPEDGLDLETALIQFERSLLMQALERTRGNKTHAAGLLRLKRTTFLTKLRTFELHSTGPALRSA